MSKNNVRLIFTLVSIWIDGFVSNGCMPYISWLDNPKVMHDGKINTYPLKTRKNISTKLLRKVGRKEEEHGEKGDIIEEDENIVTETNNLVIE